MLFALSRDSVKYPQRTRIGMPADIYAALVNEGKVVDVLMRDESDYLVIRVIVAQLANRLCLRNFIVGDIRPSDTDEISSEKIYGFEILVEGLQVKDDADGCYRDLYFERDPICRLIYGEDGLCCGAREIVHAGQ